MAAYDLPAVIEYVIHITKVSQIWFCGHSQGTTQLFAMLTLRPEYRDKINTAVALAPVVFLKHTESFPLEFVADYETEMDVSINAVRVTIGVPFPFNG